jgi:hypothetical protein
MRRRSFIRSAAAAATVPALPTPEPTKDEEQEERLYRVQLHCSDGNDEVVVVPEHSEHEAMRVATEWATHQRTLDLETDDVMASIHSTLDESTFNILRGFGHLYASSRRVYRYVDRGESHVLG